SSNVDPDRIYSPLVEESERLLEGTDSFGRFSTYLPFDPSRPVTTGKWLVMVLFSLLFGVVLGSLGRRARVVTDFVRVVRDVLLRLVRYVLYLAPIGFFALVCATALGEDSSWPRYIDGTAPYLLAVGIGLVIHAFLVLPAVLWFITRRSPLRYIGNMASSLFTALATGTAPAAFPAAYADVVDRNKVDPRAAAVALPMGMTINLNGTALLLSVTLVLGAHMSGQSLSVSQMALGGLAILVVSIVGPWFHGAQLLLLAPVAALLNLEAIGITLAAALLLPVTWLTQRFSAVVDVWGDAVGAAVVAKGLPERERPVRREEKRARVAPSTRAESRPPDHRRRADVAQRKQERPERRQQRDLRPSRPAKDGERPA
ncbi:MAG: cation:dicarboxylase symporter family transporter, partial [Candidatus Zixiibacteriota bacterium]